jgi:carbamoyl-phosphate synthase large subunit
VNDPQIEKACKLIADKINLLGSINIQLRKKDERVAIFEINPRFSSTDIFRSVFGFNDVLWSLGIHDPNLDYVSLTTSRLTAKIRRKVEVLGL